jgi:hypothetical protein
MIPRSPLPLVALALAVFACQGEPELTPVQRAAKDRAECQLLATDRTGFDPVLAPEPPPRTISETHQAGGKVVGSGAMVKGAAKGAAVGAVGGLVVGEAGKGAGAGAAAGALLGGLQRRKETKQMVTTSRPNPEYAAYVEVKEAYKQALSACLAARAQQAQQP